jgi:ParB/Sulfiredoxin domain
MGQLIGFLEPWSTIMKVRTIPIKKLRLGEHREINEKKLMSIKESMQQIGLKTPITVRQKESGALIVIAGQHRLEAAKRLKWKRIDCFVVRGGKGEAQLWNLAENLHRAELQPIEEARALRKWEQLTKSRGKDVQKAQPGGRQPHDKGISKSAKRLGLSRERVRRLRVIGMIHPDAQSSLEKAGLQQNKAALIKIGKVKGRRGQLRKIEELVQSENAPRRGDYLLKKRLQELNRAFRKDRVFRSAWRQASIGPRREFIRTVLERDS